MVIDPDSVNVPGNGPVAVPLNEKVFVAVWSLAPVTGGGAAHNARKVGSDVAGEFACALSASPVSARGAAAAEGAAPEAATANTTAPTANRDISAPRPPGAPPAL